MPSAIAGKEANGSPTQGLTTIESTNQGWRSMRRDRFETFLECRKITVVMFLVRHSGKFDLCWIQYCTCSLDTSLARLFASTFNASVVACTVSEHSIGRQVWLKTTYDMLRCMSKVVSSGRLEIGPDRSQHLLNYRLALLGRGGED